MSNLKEMLNEQIKIIQHKINEEENILHIHYNIIKPICNFLDNCSRWRDLVAAADDTMFELSEEERERCSMVFYKTIDGSPTMEVIKKWSCRGMNLKQFIYYLDRCKLESCLTHLIPIRELSIQTQPISRLELTCDDTLELICEADGFPYPLYVWFRNSVQIQHSGNEMSGKLIIPNIKLKDSGLYCCQVLQFVNEEWTYIYSECCNVNIQGIEDIENLENIQKSKHLLDTEPVILTHPKSQIQNKRGLTHFYVEAICPAHLKLEYQWFFNNKPIKDANMSDYKIIADIEHKGDYQVKVTIAGKQNLQVLSKIATLQVLPEQNQYNAGDKVALIIAISTYRSYCSLPGAENDLDYTVKALQNMNFKVISLLDLTLYEMKKAIKKFVDLVDENVYSILYFMGHGFLHNSLHYLLPWDAAQGVIPSECLCIEAAICELQEYKPKVLMVMLEICRRYYENSNELTQSNSLDFKKDWPNKVLIYSTSAGEKSFEEKIKARGIFNRYLLEVLEKPDLSIMDVFTKLQESFSKCEFNREKHSQYPEMTINLSETQRSLWNPIDPRLTDPKKLKIWNLTQTIPKEFLIQNFSYGKLIFKFKEHFSNVLKMKIMWTLQPGISIHIEINEEKLEPCIMPIKKEKDSESITFYIGNLQRIESTINLSLKMKIYENDVIKKEYIQQLPSFGFPLISAINNYQFTYSSI